MIKQNDIDIRLENGEIIRGLVYMPNDPLGLIVFAHGSGSSRLSSRNLSVARHLTKAGFATLTMDLLTEEEEKIDILTRIHRFDIAMLGRRVAETLDWVETSSELNDLALGLIGSSTGAAAALIAAVLRPGRAKAIVSRGGRPDLAGKLLERVKAPTLLLVGGLDTDVIRLNKEALALLGSEIRELSIVPGATHLFGEPGKLAEAADHIKEWCEKYVKQPTRGNDRV